MRIVALEPAPVIVATGVLTSRHERELHDPIRFRRMDRYETIGLLAVERALRAAPASPAVADPAWGVILGSSVGCWASNAAFFRDLERGPVAALGAAAFARTVSSSVNGEVSIAHRIGGVNETFVSGWTAGIEALAEAGALLAERRARWILAGGVEAPGEDLQHLLPATIEETAAVCLLTLPDPGDPEPRPRVRAYGRAYDPAGTWSLGAALDGPLAPYSVTSVVVANTVPPELLARWRYQAADRTVLSLPERLGEMGAAGGVVAVTRLSTGSTLVLARSPEGGMAALALTL